jgi:hypothetical protein
MFNKIMRVYSAIGMMFHFAATLIFVYLTRVSEIELGHGIILIAITLTGFVSSIICALYYEERK